MYAVSRDLTTLYQIQLPEQHDKKGSDSDESYEDVKVGALVSCSSKSLEDSDELPNNYVHLVKGKKKPREEGEDGGETRRGRKLNEYG